MTFQNRDEGQAKSESTISFSSNSNKLPYSGQFNANGQLADSEERTPVGRKPFRTLRTGTGPDQSVIIIGAGPAGLTAAHELGKLRSPYKAIVLEESAQVGGIARTETYKGYRFDIGGHRFFTKVKEVDDLWHEVCGNEFLLRHRLSRIYYRRKFYDYPLRPFRALWTIGPYETVRIALSYLKWHVRPHPIEDNLEQWVMNRFGGRLFQHFFRTYTEKVWGIPCAEIRADWAEQRIKNLSLKEAVLSSFRGKSHSASLIEQFHYPRLGPGMMWEMFRDRVIARDDEVRLNCRAIRVLNRGDTIDAVEVRQESETGPTTYILKGREFISSMPLADLVRAMDPPAPNAVRNAARHLKYRDFLIVVLILDHPEPFADNWIYVHSPEQRVGRIQNFRALVTRPRAGPREVQHRDGIFLRFRQRAMGKGRRSADRSCVARIGPTRPRLCGKRRGRNGHPSGEGLSRLRSRLSECAQANP